MKKVEVTSIYKFNHPKYKYMAINLISLNSIKLPSSTRHLYLKEYMYYHLHNHVFPLSSIRKDPSHQECLKKSTYNSNLFNTSISMMLSESIQKHKILLFLYMLILPSILKISEMLFHPPLILDLLILTKVILM